MDDSVRVCEHVKIRGGRERGPWAMLKNPSKSAMASTELPIPASPGPSSPLGFETTPRPRKKLSFKEPETFNYLKMRKPSTRSKLLHSQNSFDLSFDENPFEEENENLDELEVKYRSSFQDLIRKKKKKKLSNKSVKRDYSIDAGGSFTLILA